MKFIYPILFFVAMVLLAACSNTKHLAPGQNLYMGANIKIFTNGEDEHNMQIIFTVVADIRKDLQGDNTVTAGTSSLYDIIEGRDPVTLALKPESLAYILRHNVDLYQNLQFYVDVENPTKIDYAMTVGKRATDSWSNEGTLTLVAKLVQIR